MGVADGFMPKKEMIQYHTEKLKNLKKDKTYIVYNINSQRVSKGSSYKQGS